MSDKNQTPRFSEKKVDDLIAAHGQQPSEKEMSAIEAMIGMHKFKQEIRQEMKQKNEEKKKKLDQLRRRGRGM